MAFRWVAENYLDAQKEYQHREIFNKRFRYYLWCRDFGKCRYCGVSLEPNKGWHIDHIIPYSWIKHHPFCNDERNLVVSCIPCNLAKGANYWTPKPIGFYGKDKAFRVKILRLLFRV
jgi:5-methylcytosine-specific restriction endonuclease McrA